MCVVNYTPNCGNFYVMNGKDLKHRILTAVASQAGAGLETDLKQINGCQRSNHTF